MHLKPGRSARPSGAFTLIELLVFIAILAGLLLPALSLWQHSGNWTTFY